MISAFRDVRIETWNTQGLGCVKKRTIVRDAICSSAPHVIRIQETKLRAIDRFVLASFLPSHLSGYDTVDAIGSSGGILTAWDPQFLSLDSSRRDHFSLSTVLSSSLSDRAKAIFR
jgi:hypothetical protein